MSNKKSPPSGLRLVCQSRMSKESLPSGLQIVMQSRVVALLYQTIFNDLHKYYETWREDSSCIRSLKSLESSHGYRIIANQEQNIENALRICNVCIALAPPRTDEFWLALVKRSQLLSQKHDYVACLLDVNRALSTPNTCPEELRTELLCRKEDCLTHIRESNEKRSHMSAAQCASDSTGDTDGRNVIKNMLKNVEISEDQTEPPVMNHQLLEPPDLPSKNKLIPNASAKILIQYNTKYGRHIIADENILPTEVLCFEDPFAYSLQENCFRTNCANCFLRTFALIPCDGCSQAMYCGTQCRDQAYNLYHQTECKVINFLQNITHVDFCDQLVLRILLVGLMGQDGKVDLMRIDSYPPNFISQEWDLVDEKLKNDYAEVCLLARCMDVIPDSQVAGITRKVAYLLYGLTCTSFFDDSDPSVDITAEQKLVAQHLLNHYFVIQCNPHYVYETVLKPDKVTTPVGAALYSFSSLFNHSCDPNCSTYFVKKRMICYANRPIAAGEQIFISYGPRFFNKGQEERLVPLKRYNFKCECDACRMKWPVLENLPTTTTMMPDESPEVVSELLKIFKQRSDEIKWCVTNWNVINELLCFHRDLSAFLHSYFMKPAARCVLSVLEIERLMEVHGNLFVEAERGCIAAAIEVLLTYVLHIDIREWFSGSLLIEKPSINET